MPTRGDGPRAARGPVLVLVLLIVAAAVWAGDDRGAAVDPGLAPVEVAKPADLAPVAPGDGGPSTWFCAGGTAVEGGLADHVVVVSNLGETAVRGTLTAFPVRAEPLAPIDLEVAAGQSSSFRLGDLVAAEHAAAQVELEGGPAVVHHQVVGPASRDAARCSTKASDAWYVPWGQTTVGATMRLALFNPFPGDAVVDVTFDTEDGFRRPEAYQAMLVRSRQLVVLNVEEVVTRRQRVSAQIVARSGRLVVDRVQTMAVGEVVVADVGAGAPGAADAWFFPDGRVDPSVVEAFYVYNPSERIADVELTLLTGNTDPTTQPEPFQLRLPGGAAAELVLNTQTRIAQPLAHATSVQASSDVPIVVERVLASGPFGPRIAPELPPVEAATLPAGVSASLGSPLLGTRWLSGPLAPGDAGQLVVLNPGGGGDATVTVRGPDGSTVSGPATVASGRRLELPVTGAATVEADADVVVGQLWLLPELGAFAVEPAVPTRESATIASPITSFGGEAVAPLATGPPGSSEPTAPAEPPTTTAAPSEGTTTPTS